MVATVLLVISAAVLFVIPVPYVSAETVSIHYEDFRDIKVEFLPKDREIEKGGELTIIVSSQRYDMTLTGMMFYKRGPDGDFDRTTSVRPDHTSFDEGNTVTHIFKNIVSDIEMSFSDLAELGPQYPGGSDTIDAATIVTAASAILAIVLLSAMAGIRRSIDSLTGGSDSNEN
ncbi:MAG: hypothetical protein LBU30_03815 [Candidatus Methanoplasma sp.]|nr:hypothetical protein [Candidatus Methanoplasma sp.]